MKPARPAIGVLSSWLALATKSARMRSARRSAVVSCSTISASEPSAAARGRRRRWATMSSSGGPGSTNSTAVWSGAGEVAVGPVSSSPSIAASSCGWRNTVERSRSAPTAPSSCAGREVGAHDAAAGGRRRSADRAGRRRSPGRRPRDCRSRRAGGASRSRAWPPPSPAPRWRARRRAAASPARARPTARRRSGRSGRASRGSAAPGRP